MSQEDSEAEVQALREQLRGYLKLALKIHATTHSEDQANLALLRQHVREGFTSEIAYARADERARVLEELRKCL